MSDTGCGDPVIESIFTSCVAAAQSPCNLDDANCICVTQAALSSKDDICVNNANQSYGFDCWTNQIDAFCATVFVGTTSDSPTFTPTSTSPRNTNTPTADATTLVPVVRTTAAIATSTTSISTTLTSTTSITSTATSTHTTSDAPSTSTHSISSASVIPISTATVNSITPSSSTHAPISAYNGAGNILVGYCGTPEYTMLDGPTALWAPIIGCVGDKPDCCPFTVTNTITDVVGVTATQALTVTVDVGVSSSTTPSGASGSDGFPQPTNGSQETLAHCPDDYQTVAGGCCPSGYLLWNAPLGGQTPCYSTLQVPLTPPPVTVQHTADNTTTSHKPTSAVVNVVYAMHYPSKATALPALSTPTKIGIGAGSGAAAIAIGALAGLLIWRTHRHKKEKKALKKERDSLARYSVPSHASQDGAAERWRQNVPLPMPVQQPGMVGSGQGMFRPQQGYSQPGYDTQNAAVVQQQYQVPDRQVSPVAAHAMHGLPSGAHEVPAPERVPYVYEAPASGMRAERFG